MNSHRREQGAPTPSGPAPGRPWQRLSARMFWVDLAQSLLSLLPAVIAIRGLGIDPGAAQIWPLIGLGAVGVLGAISGALRWVFTRYRITSSYAELRTGVVLRVRRSIRRDRIRTVAIEAKLRHRLSGLRVVRIGAGQQAADGESALALDALRAAEARALQDSLLSPVETHAEPDGPAAGNGESAATGRTKAPQVFACFEPRWVIYNMFNVRAYIVAFGIGWSGFWLLGGLGLDVTGFVAELVDRESMGRAGTALIGFLALSILGAVRLAVTYFAEYWNFELARVRGPEGTMLRTRQGLFTTREVNRDERRIRGIQISEPVLWRWMGVSDTTVITTGLSLWSMARPAAILPRGPVTVAGRIAAEVLGTESDPFHAELARHPSAALRRRLWWATAITAGIGLVLLWLATTGVLPYAAIWAAAALWPCALGAALIAYRTLGHRIVGPYVVTRSGLPSRRTTVLQRSAVSTIVIRESLLQRHLGLQSVSTMTAAGNGGYDTPDIGVHSSLTFAVQAAPGLLDPFLSFPADRGGAPSDHTSSRRMRLSDGDDDTEHQHGRQAHSAS